MDDEFHLSQIQTMWSVVRQAHGNQTVGVESAQRVLLDRYGGAIHRYALSALRDEHAADEVFQEFALKFVRGEFGNVNPERGRFRAFVKTVVYRLIVDYQRRKKKRMIESPMHSNIAEPLTGDDEGADDELFRASWRTEILESCWKKLEDEERADGKPCHTVLRYRVDHPDARSPELAEGLSKILGKPINAGAVRVLIHRARERFADILLDLVSNSLAEGSLDEAEQELIELGLLDYCRPALERRREQND
jgi:RNA polymerase sigma factor (sigma-70 family)